MANISIPNARWRAHQEGDVPSETGGTPNLTTGAQTIPVKAHWRAYQQVCFSDDIQTAPSIQWDGVPDVVVYGTTVGATDDPNVEFENQGYSYGNVWLKFKPPYNGTYATFFEPIDGDPIWVGDTDGDYAYADIYEYLGPPNETPTSWSQLDYLMSAWFGTPFPQDYAILDKNSTYYINIYAWGVDVRGGWALRLARYDNSRPTYFGVGSPDQCETSKGWVASTIERTIFNPPLYLGDPETKSHFFYPGHDGPITVEIERAWGGLDPAIQIKRTYPTTMNVTSNDNQAPGNPLPKVTFNSSKQEDYSIIVSSANGQYGGYILKWYMDSPPGNFFDDPIVLPSSNDITRIKDTTHGATSDFVAGEHTVTNSYGEMDVDFTNQGDPAGIWYKWTAPDDGWATVERHFWDHNVDENLQLLVFSCEDDTYSSLVHLVSGVVKGSGISTYYEARFPVKQGKKYRFRVSTWGNGSYLNFILHNDTTATPVNFEYKGVEFGGGPEGSSTEFPIYASKDNQYSKEWIYISWKMRYGNSNKIEMGSDDLVTFGYITDHDGAYWSSFHLSHSQRSTISNNLIGGDNYTEGYECKQDDWVTCEVYIKSSAGFGLFVQNGRFIGQIGGGTSIRSLILGYIDDPSDRGLSILYKDVVIRDLSNRDFDYKPEPPDNNSDPNYIWEYTGLSHNLNSDGYNQKEDWAKYGSIGWLDVYPTWTRKVEPFGIYGVPVNDPDRGRAIQVKGGQNGIAMVVNDYALTGTTAGLPSVGAWSMWIKPTKFPGSTYNGPWTDTYQDVTAINTGLDSSYYRLGVHENGNLYVTYWMGRKELKRKLTLNEWACIEVITDSRYPRRCITLYLNGEEIFKDDFGYHWTENNNVDDPLRFNIGTAFPSINCAGSYDNFDFQITDVCVGPGYFGKHGPFKTTLLVPEDTVGSNYGGMWGGHINAWLKATDDGHSWSELVPGDPAHTYVNAWPFERSSQYYYNPNTKFIAQCNGYGFGLVPADFYVEFSMTNLPSDAQPVSLKVLQAVSSRDHNGPTPHVWEYSGAEVWSTARLEINGHEMRGTRVDPSSEYSGGYIYSYVDHHPRNIGNIPWNVPDINSMTIKWGNRGGGFAFSHERCTALHGLAVEVLLKDQYPSQNLAYAELPLPEITWASNWFDYGRYINGRWTPDYLSTSGCDTVNKRKQGAVIGGSNPFNDTYRNDGMRPEAVDPLFKNKIEWQLTILNLLGRKHDLQVYWRIVPAYDSRYPGFDGDFHDTDADRAAGTTSWDMMRTWMLPYAYQWASYPSIPEYPPFANTKIAAGNFDDPSYGIELSACGLLFDPCSDKKKGRIDSNGNVTVEAYTRDTWGNVSPTVTSTINFHDGCCSSNVVSNIRWRSYQQGDTET